MPHKTQFRMNRLRIIIVVFNFLIVSIIFSNCNKNDAAFLNNIPENTENLDLSFYNLKEFPARILKLKNLRYINLSNNQINSIPSKFWNLTKLESVNIGWNNIKTISDSIKNLSNLKILVLSSNKLDSLPKAITELKKLEKLEISWNNIQKLPSNLFDSNNIKELLCYQNPLLEIEYNKLTILAKKINVKLDYTLQTNISQYYAQLAYSCQQKELKAQAIFYYSKALQKDSNNVNVLANLGVLMQNSSNFDLALQYYTKCLEYNPNFAPIYFNRGLIYFFHLKQKKEACKDWNKALELDYTEAKNYITKYCK